MTGSRDEPNARTEPGPLPEPVRQRVQSLASDAIGVLRPDEVPAQLRPFARFTKAKRARLAATAIAAVLHADDEFRERVAAKVRDVQPDLAGALEAGETPAAADPVEVAAVAYLLGTEGWPGLAEAAGAETARASSAAQAAEAERELARLRDELSAVRSDGREEAERLRTELKAARAEVAELRRRLAQARSASRQAASRVAEAEAALAERTAAAERARSTGEAETRRLRSRLADAEADLEAMRRAAREGRTAADARARLLLDTLVDAAQGLRRELALPPLSTRPADSVAAITPESPAGAMPGWALSPDDPAVLDHLLSLPQVHLLVDGYNVTKTGYPDLPLEAQRSRLLAGLAVLAAQTQAEVTCVFDGAEVSGPVPVPSTRGVRVMFSPAGVSADDVIRRLVRAEPAGRPVLVVSDDREVADGVRRSGARALGAALLLRWLDRG